MKQSEVLEARRTERVLSIRESMPDLKAISVETEALVESHHLFTQVYAEYLSLAGEFMEEGQVHKILLSEDPQYRKLQENIDVLKKKYKERTEVDPVFGGKLHQEYRHKDELRQAFLVEYTRLLNEKTTEALVELKENFPEQWEEIEIAEKEFGREVLA